MESALSLMQMAKVNVKLAQFSEERLPYISVLADPTTAGVSASYALIGDVNIGEPNALIGFTGLSALACAPLALTQPAAAWGLCAVAMGFGLLHRRLKNHSAFAVVYMTAAWLMVVVGIPSVDADPPAWQPGALAAIGIGLGISANLIASQLRGVNETSRTRRPLAITKALAASPPWVCPVSGPSARSPSARC